MKRAERFIELKEEIFISFIEDKRKQLGASFDTDLDAQRPDMMHYKLAEMPAETGENGEDHKEKVA